MDLPINSNNNSSNFLSENTSVYQIISEPVLLALIEEDIDALMQAIYKIPPAFVFKAYRYMYNNLDLFGDKSKWGKFILTIQKYNYQNQVMVADSDINLAACLIELNQIGKDTGCDL